MAEPYDPIPDYFGRDVDQNGKGPDGMTPLQRQWAEHYVGHWKKHQAALDAGYKESDAANAGTRNSRNPAVMAYIARLIEGRSSRIAISTDHVLFKTVVAVEKAEQMGNMPAMVRAIEILGKQVGAFKADPASPAGAFFGGDLSKLDDNDLRSIAVILAKMGGGEPVADARPGATGTGAAGGEETAG